MMHRNSGTDGRRPLLLNDRRILQSIADNLSHVRDPHPDDPPVPVTAIHKVDNKARNAAYNQTVLQQIKESLSPYAQDGGGSVAGSDSDCAASSQDFKPSSDITDVKSAIASFNRLTILHSNGMKQMPSKMVRPVRRSSLTDDNRRASPVSDISALSDTSSGVSSHLARANAEIAQINGCDTPPPVPPRQPVMPTLQSTNDSGIVTQQSPLHMAPSVQQILRRSPGPSPVNPTNLDRTAGLNGRMYAGQNIILDNNHGFMPLQHQPIIMQQNGHPKNMEFAQINGQPSRGSPQLTIKYTPPPPYQKCTLPGVNSQNVEVANGLQAAPMQAVGAIPAPIIMPPVRSRRVEHPALHTATAPGPHAALHTPNAQHTALHPGHNHALPSSPYNQQLLQMGGNTVPVQTLHNLPPQSAILANQTATLVNQSGLSNQQSAFLNHQNVLPNQQVLANHQPVLTNHQNVLSNHQTVLTNPHPTMQQQIPANVQQNSPLKSLKNMYNVLPPQRGMSPQPNQNIPSPHNYVSLVQTQVNQRGTQQSPNYPQISNPGLQVLPNKHGYHIEIRNNPNQQMPPYPGPPQSPRQLVHIQLGNNHNRGPIYGVQDAHSRTGRVVNDTPSSTPRSDSPISRTTNQSPISYLSTTSTGSDQIPDRPPPPYPGRRTQPPIPPPRVPVTPPYPGKSVVSALPKDDNNVNIVNINNNIKSTLGNIKSANVLTIPSFNPTDTTQTTDILHKLNSANDALPVTDSSKEGSENFDNASIEDLTTDDNQSDISERSNRPWCTSPIPERTPEAEKYDISGDCIIKNLNPDAFKFFMEQRIENVIKSYEQRIQRRTQLENEMDKVDLSKEAREQMRRILYRKESNYIRLKRAKMDKAMFDYIKILGRGAFGEVALVRKKQSEQLYAMKTLRKSDVLNRNQVAHVKAERDILAEADNEWVVRLYYSFQDENNLYFVMDYVAGGDLMGLLIKFEIFNEHLARFYIAELVLAIDSVHKMGFIHRDIKPDNILIDHNGHIKLTDFGLCTGFRWTHNSKYYQKEGLHESQNSMDLQTCSEDREPLKPLDRRQRETQRCLAHSLVGTPNYIAPEVLLAEGYTACCDWWSVGVIFYEMVIGQPPFSANLPEETQYKVINWSETLKIPKRPELSPDAKELILKLCCAACNRLGRNGADEIKSHAFFWKIQFEGLRQQKAPHVPTICFDTDTSNFDPVDSAKLRPSEDNFMEALENGRHLEHAFYEFTFRRFFDNDGHPYPQVKDAESSPVYV